MEVFFSMLFLVVAGLITFVDWSNPDKKAESLHVSDRHTVRANNERKRKQILTLKRRVDFLNAKYPDKRFYREGAVVKEVSGGNTPSTKKIEKNAGDGYLSRCRVPDDQLSYRSYPLLAARELQLAERLEGYQIHLEMCNEEVAAVVYAAVVDHGVLLYSD